MGHRFADSLTRLLLRAGVLVSLLLVAGPALGADRKSQEKVARKACLTGNYAKGVAILADLFVETRNTVYIFNQGRCYEQNRRYEEALAQFEEFVRTTNSEQDKAEAEKHIEQCKAKLPRERVDSPFSPQPIESPMFTPPPRPEPAPASPPALEPTVVSSKPEHRPAVGERRWGLVTAGIITGVVGAGGVAAGLVFNLKANKAAKDVENKVGAYPTRSKDEKNFRTYAWIGYGAGAACLATGVVLMAVGAVRASPGPSTELAFVPAVGPEHMGVMLTGGF